MKLSLPFLAAALPDWKCAVLHVPDGFKTGAPRIWYSDIPDENTASLLLLPDPSALSESDIALLGNRNQTAYIWVSDSVTPPDNLSVLWIMESVSLLKVFDTLTGIFSRFQSWSDRVYRAILRQTDLQSLCELLNDVTPNTWYVSDASFRILAIRNDPMIPELSYIWKYMCEKHHLPMYILMQLSEMGLLVEMNSHKEAWITGPAPFNFPFVSYTLRTEQGITGHFYLIGIYNNPGVYETEILQFFGDLLTEYLKKGSILHATTGRYFENYFIDIIEKNELVDRDVHERILSNLGWHPEDSYVIAVFAETLSEPGTARASVNGLRVHILENSWPCRAFPYKQNIVSVFNLSLMASKDVIPAIRTAASALHMHAGYSETFTCANGFSSFRPYYLQAEAAAAVSPSDTWDKVHGYPDVFTRHLCHLLAANIETDLFIHETIRTLQSYDRENHTDLCRTLRVYLESFQNTTRAADQLYIHRNTLLHRLHLISSFAETDLQNPAEVFRLQLSFYLLDYLAPENSLPYVC